MKKHELVIAGGGLTAARAIKSYREAGGEGRITLLSKESVLPYHRPPLSKRYRRDAAAAPRAGCRARRRARPADAVRLGHDPGGGGSGRAGSRRRRRLHR